MYNSQEIALKIKETAKIRKISIKQLLEKCDLNINYISELGKGKQASALNISKIADCLEVSTDYLLGRTDNKNGYSNSFNNGDNSTQAIGDCNNISTNISSSDKNNMYNDIIEHLDTLSKSDRFRAIADITDILEEKYPVKKN